MGNPQKTCDEWNRTNPFLGIPIDVKNDFGEVTRRLTESMAWVLGREPVILVSGISGGYLLERCEVI